MPLVETRNLQKQFGSNQVLKGIDFAVEPGQVVAIIGRSGSGKSTLLRTLNGLESIDEGTIEIDGEHMDARHADLRALRLKVGMVFQQYNLFPHLTAGQNVMLAQTVVKKVHKAKARATAEQVLERVGLRGQVRRLSRAVIGRTAAACRDCSRARDEADGAALRRDHIGAGSGACG